MFAKIKKPLIYAVLSTIMVRITGIITLFLIYALLELFVRFHSIYAVF